MEAKTIEKHVQIKLNVLARSLKDYQCYNKEVISTIARIEKMKENSTIDPYDIKKAGDVLDETKSMVVDAMRRIEDAKSKFMEVFDVKAASEEKDGEASDYDIFCVKALTTIKEATDLIENHHGKSK
uniref:Tubulin-specific chaperone A n=1 Tax=Rhabditophanes sp. KR3021 TaxID=114890 RepID=A0AC35U1E0_9BILA